MPESNDPLCALPLRYRVWLKLLPAHVRDQHGRELRDDLLGEQPSVLSVAADILRASPRARWDLLRQDLRLSFRQLRRDGAFAAIAGITLATGIQLPNDDNRVLAAHRIVRGGVATSRCAIRRCRRPLAPGCRR